MGLFQLKAKYKPDAYEGLRWSVALKRIPKRIFGGSFTIHVFLDLPYDPTPGHPALSDPHYVGPVNAPPLCWAERNPWIRFDWSYET